jgi:metallo-beta-lactamase class B
LGELSRGARGFCFREQDEIVGGQTPVKSLVCFLLLAGATARLSYPAPAHPGNGPFPPYRVIGNIYYVGAEDITSYLITTPQGHMVINSGYEDTPALIKASVLKLGFRMQDIKFLLNGQAHYDHVAGQAALQKMTGAKVIASERDARVIETGGKADTRFGKEMTYPTVHVDRIVRDGDRVVLGGVTLVAHLTPGHSIGCTTWTMIVNDGSKPYNVVFVGGTSINPGVLLLGLPTYPGIAEDYAKTFRVLRSLPCDVFLGAHGGYYGMLDKYTLLQKGVKPNPFIDPSGYRAFVDDAEKTYLSQLAREKATAAKR